MTKNIYRSLLVAGIVLLLNTTYGFGITKKFDLSGAKKSGKTISIAPTTVYGANGNDYGYDLGTTPNGKNPFFFSTDVPEGNYRVTVKLGDPEKASVTTVKAESRRLMIEKVKTDAGKYVTKSFIVNIRNKKIGDSDSVRINEREIGKLIWDDKLTLEFNGENPSVQTIEIESVDNIPTIFLAGNSTVVDEGLEPWSGWGQIFTRFFKPTIAVANYAESGQAANTFVSSKRLEKLLTKIKPGDYLFIEFGHNDQKQKGEGMGPYTSFKNNLKRLADSARVHGATPILVTPMHRRFFDEAGKVINTHGDYPDAVRQLAKEENITLIDLNNMSETLYEAWGVENSKRAFVQYPANTFPNQPKALEDNTHFNPYGGYQIAKCILRGIFDNNLPLTKYVVDDYVLFDPAKPDNMDTFSIPATPFSSTVKPLGN